MNVKIEDIRMDFFKSECQYFKEDITNHYWKKILGDCSLESDPQKERFGTKHPFFLLYTEIAIHR